jgi:hypothetical protein
MTRQFVATLVFAALQGFATLAFATLTPLLPEQRAPAGSLFQPIEVQVTDSAGRPVQGAAVRWTLGLGQGLSMRPSQQPGCIVDLGWYCTTTSDAAGIATLPRMLGSTVGQIPFRISSDYGDAIVTLVIEAASLPTLSLVSGSGQRAVIGTLYSEPFVVRVLRDGAPAANVLVNFGSPLELNVGGPPVGSFLGEGDVATDANGYAVSPPFQAGWGVGTGTVPARPYPFGAVPPVSFSFTNTNAQGGTTLDFQDMWWVGPEENGWGLSVNQHEDRIFSLLFAYDDAGNPTWRVMDDGGWTAGTGSTFRTFVRNAHGAPFSTYDASRFSLDLVGSVSLGFEGEQRAHIGGGINVPWLEQGFGGFSKWLQRWDFSNGSTEPLYGVADIWWGGPSQAGWGIAIFERPGLLFSMWFTYDDAGHTTWYVMPEGTWTSPSVFEGRILSAKSSGWIQHYDASKFRLTDVGPFRLRFLGQNSAEFDYNVNGRTGTLRLERFDF